MTKSQVVGDLPCWCADGTWRLCFRTPRFGLVRCTSCGCHRIDPPPIYADQQSAEFYTQYYSNGSSTRTAEAHPKRERDSRFWRVTAQVPSLNDVGHSVLDIGCGEGHLCAELEAAGWPSVSGIDISRTRIARARELYPRIDFYDTPIGETSLPPRSFDLLTMDNVLEHLPDPLGTLSQLRDYLSPNGRLVVITPNMHSGHFRLLGGRWTQELSPHTHIFLFTTSSISLLLAKAGFEVADSGSFHLSFYSFRSWMVRLFSGEAKGALWRSMQELGGLYGRLIGEGPMLYAVARVNPSAPRGKVDPGGTG